VDRTRPFLKGLSLLAAGFCLAGAAVPEDSADQAALELEAAAEWDEFLESVGHRLALDNVRLCSRRVWRTGIVVHDLHRYAAGSRAAAIRAFGVGLRPSILALAPEGSAAQAGLRPGDILLSADGAAFAESRIGRAGTGRGTTAALDTLDAAFADGAAVLEVERGGTRLRLPVRAEQGCLSRFQLQTSTETNAGADGLWVRIPTAFARTVRSTDEFAALVAHEFAHNVLGHRGRSQISQLFNAGTVRAQEIAADRLSVWLLDGASYDPRGAIAFWQRFGPSQGTILAGPTHPGWRRRVAILEAEIAEMRRLKADDPEAISPVLALRSTETSAPRPPARRR